MPVGQGGITRSRMTLARAAERYVDDGPPLIFLLNPHIFLSYKLQCSHSLLGTWNRNLLSYSS